MTGAKLRIGNARLVLADRVIETGWLVAKSDATRTLIPIYGGHHSDDRGQLVMSG